MIDRLMNSRHGHHWHDCICRRWSSHDHDGNSVSDSFLVTHIHWKTEWTTPCTCSMFKQDYRLIWIKIQSMHRLLKQRLQYIFLIEYRNGSLLKSNFPDLLRKEFNVLWKHTVHFRKENFYMNDLIGSYALSKWLMYFIKCVSPEDLDQTAWVIWICV